MAGDDGQRLPAGVDFTSHNQMDASLSSGVGERWGARVLAPEKETNDFDRSPGKRAWQKQANVTREYRPAWAGNFVPPKYPSSVFFTILVLKCENSTLLVSFLQLLQNEHTVFD